METWLLRGMLLLLALLMAQGIYALRRRWRRGDQLWPSQRWPSKERKYEMVRWERREEVRER